MHDCLVSLQRPRENDRIGDAPDDGLGKIGENMFACTLRPHERGQRVPVLSQQVCDPGV
jgi:hypothetical protein